MKILFVSILLIAASNAVHSAEKFTLTLQHWSQPKTIDSVLSMPAVNGVLKAIQNAPESRLLILYPGGDVGTLWAHELKSWLVSVGVTSRQIELRPGSSDPSSLEMLVESPISGQ